MNVTLICSQPRGLQAGMGAHHYLQSGVTIPGGLKLGGAGVRFVWMICDRVRLLSDGCS